MGDFVADAVLIICTQEAAVGNLNGKLVGRAGDNISAVIANFLVKRNEGRHPRSVGQQLNNEKFAFVGASQLR